MPLVDMGADVVRVARAGAGDQPADGLGRGRTTVSVDLKSDEGRDLVRRLAEHAEVLVEGFRPGVTERLGLGPDELVELNPRLLYGPMTGYGQDGPLSSVAGHDINYISIAGVLGAMARRGERPLFPMNLVGDFGGGGMLLAFGVVGALLGGGAPGGGGGGWRGRGRSSTRRWSTGPRCCRRSSTASARWASGTTSRAPTCSTPARTSTRST